MNKPLSLNWAYLLSELLHKDSYSLELRERIQEHRFVTLSLHTLYSSLRNMERLGWLRSYETEPMGSRGQRPRIMYSITQAGREAFERDCAREDL